MSSKARFTSVKVFSATLPQHRDALGDQVTKFLAESPELEVVDKAVTQSSDKEFHCLSLTLFLAPRDASKSGEKSGEKKPPKGWERDSE